MKNTHVRSWPMAAALVALSSLLGANLNAQEPVYDLTYSSSRPAGVSGQDTGVTTEFSVENAPLTRLAFWENNDKPCGVAVRTESWSRFENGSVRTDQDPERLASGCQRGSTVNSVANVTVNGIVNFFRDLAQRNGRPVNANINNSYRGINLPDGYGLTSVRICVRSGNGRLKGVHVSYAQPTPSGLQDEREMRFERPRCNKWEGLAECPAGQIGTKLITHRSDPDIIAGLELECARPRFTARAAPKTPPPPPPPPTPNATVQQQSGLQLYRNPVSRTAVSGDAGTGRLLFSDEPDAFVTGIQVWERNNQPCRLTVTYRTEPASSDHTKTFNACNGNTTSNAWGLDITDDVPWTDENTYGVSGIRICQRQSNGRLKGIQLFGARINGNTVTRDNSIDPDEALSNCNDWQTPRQSCPSNQIAAGVIVHFRDNNNGADEITGLALRCARTTLLPS